MSAVNARTGQSSGVMTWIPPATHHWSSTAIDGSGMRWRRRQRCPCSGRSEEPGAAVDSSRCRQRFPLAGQSSCRRDLSVSVIGAAGRSRQGGELRYRRFGSCDVIGRSLGLGADLSGFRTVLSSARSVDEGMIVLTVATYLRGLLAACLTLALCAQRPGRR